MLNALNLKQNKKNNEQQLYGKSMATCSVVCLSFTNGSEIKCGLSWNKQKQFLVGIASILKLSCL